MKDKFPGFCSIKQANKIYELLTDKQREIGIGLPVAYNISDIFKYLPHQIIYNDHRGDLSISVCDIAYFSVGGGWEHVLVHFEDIPIGGDIFDAFIKMLEWLKENNLLTKNE